MEKKIIDGKEVWVDADGKIVENYTPPTTYTQEELDAKLQAESDKRVSQALKTAQEKWEKEFKEKLEAEKSEAEKLAKMSEADRLKAEFDKQKQAFEEERKQFQKQQLEMQTVKELSAIGLPVEFTQFVMADNADTIKTNIDLFKTHYDQSLEKAVNERLQGTTPKGGTVPNSGGITKEQFAKMSIIEKSKLMNENPELVNELYAQLRK